MVSSARRYLGLMALLGLERGAELLLSSRNARRLLARGAREEGQGLYRAMVAAHALFLAAGPVEVLVRRRRFPGPLGWLWLAAALGAQGLRWWAIATLGERWSTRVVVPPGAAPVSSGPYRYLRHPNYLAVVIEALAVPMVHGAWITALAFSLTNAALLSARIPLEERALGASYAAAFSDRPRLLPRVGA